VSELRWHPLLRQWVAVAAARQNRPQMPANWCPFDPGSGGVPDHYDVFLYPNDFAAFALDGAPFSPDAAGLFGTTGARGATDVVLYHPDHNLPPSQMTLAHWRKVVGLWTRRYCEISAHPDIQYVYIFENTGVAIGVTMPHPHGQIYSFPYVPPYIQTELDSASSYFRENKSCLYCSILEGERRDGRRIFWENSSFVAMCPFYARYPSEGTIYARRHVAALPELKQSEADDLAEIVKVVRMKYDNLYGFPMPLMMILRQRPSKGDHPYFHFHIDFYPIQRAATKLKYIAGVESGAGTFLNDTLAEEEAAKLRGIAPDAFADADRG
jgi:UDPglucose--hexose-1-phosphate uridylyltransferase